MKGVQHLSIAAFLIACVILPITASPAFAQTGEDAFRFMQRAPGVGVRAMSMGGASGAGIGDFADFAFNPAGVAYSRTSQFSGSIDFWNTDNAGTYEMPAFTRTRANDIRQTTLGHIAYLYRVPTVRGSLVVGGALAHTANYERTLNFEGNYTHWTGGNILHTGRVTDEGGLRTLHIGGGWEAAENVMVGVSANFAFGQYRFRGKEDHQTDLGGFVPDDLDFDLLVIDDNFTSDLAGFGIRAGIASAVTPFLRLGFSIETPTFLSVNEVYASRIDALYLGEWYVDEDRQGEFDYSITTPWRLGGGITFTEGAVTVAGDLEMVDWSQMRLRASRDRAYFDDVNEDIRERFGVALNGRVGAEFALGDLRLRGGLGFQQDPRQNAEIDRGRASISAGIGYLMGGQVEINAGWSQKAFDDRYVPYSETAVNAPSPVINEAVSRNRFAVGLVVRL
jgi:long-subunit fatty acid transport protein